LAERVDHLVGQRVRTSVRQLEQLLEDEARERFLYALLVHRADRLRVPVGYLPGMGQSVCVLGMSRAGTSLTARVLNLLGVYLGPEEELLGGELRQIPAHDRGKARAANPDGFWEHYRLMRINEAILHRFGGSWREPPELPPGWEGSERLAEERERAADLLEQTFGDRPLWGWKDPRNSLTLPFWQWLIPDLRHVICLRNPVDVAASLERREEGLAAAQAFQLWQVYLTAALAHTEGRPRVLVAYEEYFDDWRVPVARLAAAAGVRPPAEGSAASERIERTIKAGLRHHRTPAADVLEDSRLPEDVRATYIDASRAIA
jgi:hypothetical protein